MTRKDFKAIAAELCAERPKYKSEDALYSWGRCCVAVANALADRAPRFVRSKFLEACGYYPS